MRWPMVVAAMLVVLPAIPWLAPDDQHDTSDEPLSPVETAGPRQPAISGPSPVSVRHPALAPHQQFAGTRWLLERGYLDNGYRNYSDSVLRAMAASDHLPALEELARRLAVSDPQNAMQPGWRAAVMGSSSGAVSMAKGYFEQARLLSMAATGDHQTPLWLASNAAAYALVAWRQADPTGKSIIDAIMAVELLDPADLAQACDVADAIWQDLLDERQALGLPPPAPEPPPIASTDLENSHICPGWRDGKIRCARRPGVPAAIDLDAWSCR